MHSCDILKPRQEYLYLEDESAVAPEPITIYGVTEKIPNELREYVLDSTIMKV